MHVRVGKVDDMVAAKIGGRVEPEPRDLGQHLSLERCRGEPESNALSRSVAMISRRPSGRS